MGIIELLNPRRFFNRYYLIFYLKGILLLKGLIQLTSVFLSINLDFM